METPRKGSTAVEAGDAVERTVEGWVRGVDSECGVDEASKQATEVV